MLLDAWLAPGSLNEFPALARAAEAAGFAAVWTTELQHNPFLPLPLVAEHSARMGFGTTVAVAFARSPTVLAHVAWDLAAQSGGRFMLGLGTQVRAHVERRFGQPWPESPVGKLRDLIQAMRAVWRSWQTGERLNYRGDYYKLNLMSPFFSPGPIDWPHIPIYLAGVNTGLARLAGEIGDGFTVHPLTSAAYVREVLRPAIAAGAQSAGRAPGRVCLTGIVFAISSADEREKVRQQIAFYASTPSYRPMLAHHGWESVGEQLSSLLARAEWSEMPALIDDAMLSTFAVEAPPDRLAAALHARYDGLVDRIVLYRHFTLEKADEWRSLVEGIK